MINKISQISTDNKIMLDKLIQQHPQLTEKAIVDYINGLEVINDHISVSEKITKSDSLVIKLVEYATGKHQLRQQIINKNFANSLETVSDWLNILQDYQIYNDKVITHLADKLAETRDGVMRLQSRHSELAARLEQWQSQIDNEFTELKKNVQREAAFTHLDIVFKKWDREPWKSYPPLVGLYLSIDELHWGDFGTYYRNSSDSKKVNELIKSLTSQASEKIEQELEEQGIKRKELFERTEWLQPICSLPDDQPKVLAYLSDWAVPNTAPVTWSIQSYASNYSPPHADKEMPIVLSTQRAVERLIDEHNNRL